MLRATEVIAKGDWNGIPADSVVLDFDDRHRRRIAMTGVGGLAFLLDLAETVALRSGDAVRLEDGRIVEIVGAPEQLVEIRAESAEKVIQLAWHLGNRHLPVQVVKDRLRIRRDGVIEHMLSGLGARLRILNAPFDPEGGAYAEARHAHAHGAPDGHREHGHTEQGHVHHAGCGHDHAHHGHDHHDHDHHAHAHHDHGHGHKHG